MISPRNENVTASSGWILAKNLNEEKIKCYQKLREAPFNESPPLFGHCPFGGGVSTLARMVWGSYLEKNCPSSNGHLVDCGGGQNACQDALGHLCSEN